MINCIECNRQFEPRLLGQVYCWWCRSNGIASKMYFSFNNKRQKKEVNHGG